MSYARLAGEALTDNSDSARGEIRAGKWVMALFFLGFGGWAAFAPLDAAVVAPGVIVVLGNKQTVQHREGGVISRLLVAEGDHVERGQVLLELGAPEVVAQERALLSQIVDLEMQRARLDAEQSGTRILSRPQEWEALSEEDQEVADAAFERHQREISGGSWSQYEARIIGYRGEIAALQRQEELLNQELTGTQALVDEQFMPLTRVRALERALSELQGRRSELAALIASTQQERQIELRQVDARLAELTPQLAGARERVEQMRIRAPVTGTVVGLQVHNEGGVVRPTERVMDIVPDGQELVVEAQVRPEDADDLHEGLQTEVRITAFNGRNLPIVHGRVRQVSADRFVDERTGRGYFLTQVVVPAAELNALLDEHAGGRRLRAGLPAQVIIPTRKRTALQYLVEPLNQTLWQSLREQ